MPQGSFDEINVAQHTASIRKQIAAQVEDEIRKIQEKNTKELNEYKRSEDIATHRRAIELINLQSKSEIDAINDRIKTQKLEGNELRKAQKKIANIKIKASQEIAANEEEVAEKIAKKQQELEKTVQEKRVKQHTEAEERLLSITARRDAEVAKSGTITAQRKYFAQRALEEKAIKEQLSSEIESHNVKLALIEEQRNSNQISADEYLELKRDEESIIASLAAKRHAAEQRGNAMLLQNSRLLMAEARAYPEFTQEATEQLQNNLTELENNARNLEAKISVTTDTAELDALQKQLMDINETRASVEDIQKKGVYADTTPGEALGMFTKRQGSQLLDKIGWKIGESVGNNINNTLKTFISTFANPDLIEEKIKSFYQYQAKVNARLQGTGQDYSDVLDTIADNVGISPYVKQANVVEKLVELSDKGVAYNLELRAFLGEVSESIASTFDAFDSNLLRLIRLQQADTTAARLGMEASLTQLFNKYFTDTSYLTDMAQTVSAALIDANSQMTRDMSIEFEYIVQKWLGALYSVGMDQNTVSSIATAFNYLATGDVENLSNNTQMMNLIAMSASRVGEDLGDILTNGLDPDTTNTLLKSVVEYLQEIAEAETGNMVTKSAFADTFGFSIADLTAAKTLAANTAALSDLTSSYNDAMSELNKQFGQLSDRVHITQYVNTIMDNVVAGTAQNVGSTAGGYIAWKLANMIASSNMMSEIPQVLAGGFGLDLHANLGDIMYNLANGIPLAGALLGAAFSGNGMGFNFNVNPNGGGGWNYTPFLSEQISASGKTSKRTSISDMVAGVRNSNFNDVEDQTLSDAADTANENEDIVNQHVKGHETGTYDALVTEDTDVVTEVIAMNERLDKYLDFGRVFITSGGGGGSGGSSSSSSPSPGITSIPSPGTASTPSSSGSQTTNPTPVGSQTSSGPTNSSNRTPVDGSLVDNVTVDPSIELLKEEVSTMSDFLETALAQDRVFKIETISVTPSRDGPIYSTLPATPSYYEKWKNMFFYQADKQKWLDVEEKEKETQETISRLENLVSEHDLETISSLMTATELAREYAMSSSTTSEKTEQIKVSLDQMSPEVSSYLAAAMKSMMTSALLGAEGSGSLVEELKKMIDSLQDVPVRVTNDNFDTTLQKISFTY